MSPLVVALSLSAFIYLHLSFTSLSFKLIFIVYVAVYPNNRLFFSIFIFFYYMYIKSVVIIRATDKMNYNASM